jgi:hypothetical protein
MILCVILIAWLISLPFHEHRLPINEINLILFKVKLDPSPHIIDGVVFVMLFASLMSMWAIQFRIKDEIDHLEQPQFVSIPFAATDEWQHKEDARQAATKKQWETLYDKITHSKNTALFAFIRYDPETNEPTDSDVQNVLWFIIKWVPLLFIAFWGYVLIKEAVVESRIARGSGVIWYPVIGLVFGATMLWYWLRMIQNDYHDEITKSVLKIGMLANGLYPGQ